jgi:hypothetical protein
MHRSILFTSIGKVSMRRWISLVTAGLVMWPASAAGFGGAVGIFHDASAWDCAVHDREGLVPVYVVHTGSDGTAGSKFAAPLPSCWQGAVHLFDDVQTPVSIGDSQSGIEIAYGRCVEGAIHILTIWVVSPGTTEDCCPYSILPHPAAASGEVESIDCTGEYEYAGANDAVVSTSNFCGCGPAAPPGIENPAPPDSAAGVPLVAQLAWDPASVRNPVYRVRFGTNPPLLPIIADGLAVTTADPGPLQPSTMYYWQVEGCPDQIPPPPNEPCAYSPIWRFTTTGTVPTDDRTWGAIKALFRAD